MMTDDVSARASDLPFDLTSFRTAYDENPQAFCIVYVHRAGGAYTDLTFVYANRAYAQLVGFPLLALLGKRYSALMGQPSPQRMALYGETAYGGGAQKCVLPGNEPGTLVSIQCFRLSPGYCGSNVLDVTPAGCARQTTETDAGRKRADEERSMYQTLLNQSSAMITVIDATTFRILYANAAAQAVTRDITGGYVGAVCYECVAHRTAPCPNCILARANAPAEETRELSYGGRIYRMVYKRIEWNGRPALMEYSEDVTEQKRVTELAEANARQHQNIIANLPAGVIVYRIIDHDYQVVQVNPAICRMLGLEPDEATGSAGDVILSIVAPEDRALVYDAAVKMAVPNTNVYYEFRGRIKGQEGYIWLGASGRSALQPDGSLYVYICYRDISDRKDKELQFQHKLEYISNLDNDKLIAKGRHNLTRNQLLIVEVKSGGAVVGAPGETYDDLLKRLADTAIEPRERAALGQMLDRERLLRAFAEGQREFSLDYRRRMEGGRKIWATVKCSLYEEPRSHDIITFLYSYDNTEQIQEAQIITRIGMLVYGVIGLIEVTGGQYRTVYVSEADRGLFRMTQGDYASVVDRRCLSARILGDREGLRQAMSLPTVLRELQTRTIYPVEYSCQTEGGASARMRFHFSYLDDSRDTIIFFRSDITESYLREQAQVQEIQAALSRAQEASQAKSVFFSRMSHDMRTPMNGILGMAMLSEQEQDAAVLRDNLRKIRESGQYLLCLINDTLDMQRIESGRMVLEPQIVSTLDVVDNILDMVRSTAEAKGVTLKYSPGNADLNWYIRADALRLKQVFVNLLSNAVKFTPAGGTVELTFQLLSREGMISHDLLCVRDTGVGMSRDFLERGIFQPFSQESNQVSTQYAGSGLGLSIAKSLIELMGGRIEVESELGEGTTFSVYLDFERVEPEAAKARLTAGQRRTDDVLHRLSGRRILLVEDHPLNAEIATKLLQKAGCTVTWVNNGQVAVEAFRRAAPHAFDAVLMDIRMPVMDGLTATRTLRGLDRPDAKVIPIIAMTANAYEEDVRQALAAGMNAHLSKPIAPELMYQTIAQALQGE